ncbi:MAG: family 20 glycosylhydrolase [Muribaculaceae bacterium]|nr:family 20 glycosylhydrolase [Muribaculaceae bacterium]
MKTLSIKALLIAAVMTLTSISALAQSPISVRWDMGTNDAKPGYYSSRFVITNVSGKPLEGNWMFFFNQFSRKLELSPTCPVDINEISTTYYLVKPNERYAALADGDSLVIDLMMKGKFVNLWYAPNGGHVVLNGDTHHPIAVTIERSELKEPGQWSATTDYPDGAKVFDFNEDVAGGFINYTPTNIIPTPKKVTLDEERTTVRLPNLVSFKAPSFFKSRKQDIGRVKAFLTKNLAFYGIHVMDDCPFVIEARLDKKLSTNIEHYELEITDSCIVITGVSDIAVLNGAKTLIAALSHTKRNNLMLCKIVDEPDFAYRGFMADIARNFYGLDDLKKLVDLLALYKINTIQFHFADDEAWRIEIPGLPELTEVASRRGCTLNELEDGFLAQIFDGNGNPNDLSQSANGFLTRAQFIEFLRYAKAHGIKVIPEIDTPGHSRAAIVAMKYRYNKFSPTNLKKAQEFMLWDPNDKGGYQSVQAYADNVLNPAQEGTYRFIGKVVGELEKMYRAAGLKLDIVHLGGDEVASGCWDNSPAVKALMTKMNMKDTHDMMEHYIDRVSEMLIKRGIKIEGWQEVALNHSDSFNKRVAPRFAGVNAWSTIGSRIEVPYKIANAGYPTILSNVDCFYMDMGYSMHQYEQGLHWGGSVNEFDSWKAQPWNLYGDNAEGKTPLTRRDNIIGVQAQLWGETLRNFSEVEKLLIPKILGVAERGWNASPYWAGDDVEMSSAREDYNLNIGFWELPMLNKRGYNFHLAQPGIKVENGKLLANAQYPMAEVRYTFDGSEPTPNSPIWTTPVAVPENCTLVKAKAFYLGKQSVTTYLFLK